MTKRGIPKKAIKKPLKKQTRITYTDDGLGTVTSNPILLGCEIVVVKIDKVKKLYRIVDAATGKYCFILGPGETVLDCKKKARARLLANSASIYEEVRIRK